MMNISNFKEIEKKQSHTFINSMGERLILYLGWKKYKKFNERMNGILLCIKESYNIDVYLHEHEDIHIERNFYWIYSFSTEDSNNLLQINNTLKYLIEYEKSCYCEIERFVSCCFNNHSSDFKNYMHPDLAHYYAHMVTTYDHCIKPTYPPREKSFAKKYLMFLK